MVEVHRYAFGGKNQGKVTVQYYPKSLVQALSLLFTLLLHVWSGTHLPQLYRKFVAIQEVKARNEQPQVYHIENIQNSKQKA